MYLTNSHSNVAGINDSPFSLPSLPLIGRQLIGNLGAVPDPTLAPRCASLMVTVPATYQELEATVRNWIATCVTSRTQSGGRPIHREIALVTNNPSLINLWNTALKNITGQKVQVIARYKWRMGGVESIDSRARRSHRQQLHHRARRSGGCGRKLRRPHP